MTDSSARETVRGQAFSVQGVFDRARGVFARRWLMLIGGAVLTLLAMVVIQSFLLFGVMRAGAYASALMLVPIAALFLWSALIQGFVVFAAISDFSDRPVKLWRSLGVGFARMGDVFLIQLAQLICAVVGTLLLVVPAMFAAVVLCVAVPVAVIERKGPVASLTRSFHLTKGLRWKVFGVLVVVVAANLLAVGLWSMLSLSTHTAEGYTSAAPLAQLMMFAIVLLQNVATVTVTASLYAELRLAQEPTSVGVEQAFS